MFYQLPTVGQRCELELLADTAVPTQTDLVSFFQCVQGRVEADSVSQDSGLNTAV